jgi:MFS transporter, DHA2 family, multidrug resistance protein
MHRAYLVQNIVPTNPAFRQVFDATRGLMVQTTGPGVGDLKAYGVIQGMLDQQAASFSYVDVFRYLAIACFVCGAIVILMKRVRAKKGAPAMAH